jgi:pyruvate formate lyase activating enzyme
MKDEDVSVKLDTNGSNPTMLQRLIKEKLVDYVAMDIKAPLYKYEQIARLAVNKGDIQKSVDILRKGVVDFEFRTTVVPGLIEERDLHEIGEWLRGVPKFFLQQFRPVNTLDETFTEVKPLPEDMVQKFCELLRPYFDHFAIKGLERVV